MTKETHWNDLFGRHEWPVGGLQWRVISGRNYPIEPRDLVSSLTILHYIREHQTRPHERAHCSDHTAQLHHSVRPHHPGDRSSKLAQQKIPPPIRSALFLLVFLLLFLVLLRCFFGETFDGHHVGDFFVFLNVPAKQIFVKFGAIDKNSDSVTNLWSAISWRQ